MRLAFVVNDVATEIDEYTTTRLARAACQGGHEVWYLGVADVELGESEGHLIARARRATFEAGDTLESFTERTKEGTTQRVVLDQLDALYLRTESITTCRSGPGRAPSQWSSGRCSRPAVSRWS